MPEKRQPIAHYLTSVTVRTRAATLIVTYRDAQALRTSSPLALRAAHVRRRSSSLRSGRDDDEEQRRGRSLDRLGRRQFALRQLRESGPASPPRGQSRNSTRSLSAALKWRGRDDS
jgi:hypothetical protein